jgi:hypothetical protein
MKRFFAVGAVALFVALGFFPRALTGRPSLHAQQATQATQGAPQFTAAGQLIRPDDFREWVFVSSGLGMAYNPAVTPNPSPNFTNVYVNPSSYRGFMKTGQWPDQTIFVLEVRGSTHEGSINKAGSYQTGLVGIDAEVKDTRRFPGKWAFFAFGRTTELKDRVEALPHSADCYACHSSNGAVDNTFVQFYPTLLDVARRMKTVH